MLCVLRGSVLCVYMNVNTEGPTSESGPSLLWYIHYYHTSIKLHYVQSLPELQLLIALGS